MNYGRLFGNMERKIAPPQPVRKRHFFNVSQRIEPLSRPNLSPSEGILFFIIIFD